MPSQNAVLMQAVVAFAQGCGGVQVEDAAYEWFHERYFPWISTTKSTGKTPQEVWDEYGQDFLEQFRRIGRRAAASGSPVQAEMLQKSALAVEEESTCPYCP